MILDPLRRFVRIGFFTIGIAEDWDCAMWRIRYLVAGCTNMITKSVLKGRAWVPGGKFGLGKWCGKLLLVNGLKHIHTSSS